MASLLALVLSVAGCVSGRHPEARRADRGCDSIEGVFSNLGRNDEDPAEKGPEYLRAYLLDHLVTPDELSPRIIKGAQVAVAIRHLGGGRLRFAVLDSDGTVLTTGIRSYDRCSKGVLQSRSSRELGAGWIGSDEKLRHFLVINAGRLMLSLESTAAGMFLGFPIVGGSAAWWEFPPDPRFDLDDLDL
ncbi:MAG: hypothetical protein DWQ36_16405 [Acidobacteria bacterium]|nr:MAG: hypothetical protein DWQ30_16475 [Acidobacteriota bacterium]REK05386.1 MAG: hypothetical protein DWQ36_16405 [Acidobacteriota bacterium]